MADSKEPTIVWENNRDVEFPFTEGIGRVTVFEDDDAIWLSRYNTRLYINKDGERKISLWRSSWVGFIVRPKIEIRMGQKSRGSIHNRGMFPRRGKMRWTSKEITHQTTDVSAQLTWHNEISMELIKLVAQKFEIELPQIQQEAQLPSGVYRRRDDYELADHLAKAIFLKAFPSMAWPIENGRPHSLPKGIIAAFRQPTLADACEKIFRTRGGQTVTALADALVEDRDQQILMASMLRKHLALEDIRMILNTPSDRVAIGDPLIRWPQQNKVAFRDLMSRYSRQRIVNLLVPDLRNGWLDDTIRMWVNKDVREVVRLPRRPRNMREIHDLIAREYGRVRHANQEINYNNAPVIPWEPIHQPVNQTIQWEEWKKVDGIKMGNYVLKLPQDTHEVIAWGTEMRNCIGGYAGMAAQGTIVLGALVDENGKVCYNFSVRGKTLEQLYGPMNEAAPYDVTVKVNSVLREHKLITNEWAYYVGYGQFIMNDRWRENEEVPF